MTSPETASAIARRRSAEYTVRLREERAYLLGKGWNGSRRKLYEVVRRRAQRKMMSKSQRKAYIQIEENRTRSRM